MGRRNKENTSWILLGYKIEDTETLIMASGASVALEWHAAERRYPTSKVRSSGPALLE